MKIRNLKGKIAELKGAYTMQCNAMQRKIMKWKRSEKANVCFSSRVTNIEYNKILFLCFPFFCSNNHVLMKQKQIEELHLRKEKWKIQKSTA